MGARQNKRFRLDMRRGFFSVRTVKHGNRLLVLGFLRLGWIKATGAVLQLMLL